MTEKNELLNYCQDVAQRARAASRVLVRLSGEVKNNWLRTSAKLLREQKDALQEANAKDLEAGPSFGLTDAAIDRLRLSDAGIENLATALEEVAQLPDPSGTIISSNVRPNGIRVDKMRVPLGVIFFIYESRPNVTADAAALCVKSGNAVILRGGKEAFHSNQAIGKLLHQAAAATGLPADVVQLVSTTDRDAVGHFLTMSEFIDVTIPRGGETLIRRVSEGATMPVIKHYAGNCHVYIDAGAEANLASVIDITINSKCQRMGVCNACESLLLAEPFVKAAGKQILLALHEQGVELRVCKKTAQLLGDVSFPTTGATEDDHYAEYLGPVISVKTVADVEEAIAHCNKYSSGHTEVILTQDLSRAKKFVQGVDSSAVLVNASSRFNDGGQFGLGAEIGISTDKFHARGPCGLEELTSYKYVVFGDGQIRE